MNPIQKITWLIGSPKAKNSSSEALGTEFTQHFARAGATVARFQSHRLLRRQTELDAFLENLDESDLFVISFPLYVDSLPYVLTAVLEMVAAHRQSTRPTHKQRIVCIANCGFPEAHHNDLALRMCLTFAGSTGFEWYGGIAIGEGGAVAGQLLENRGAMTKGYRDAFAESATSVLADKPIPQETIATFANPLMPHRMYTLAGTLGWFYEAHRRGSSWRQLWNKPYDN